MRLAPHMLVAMLLLAALAGCAASRQAGQTSPTASLALAPSATPAPPTADPTASPAPSATPAPPTAVPTASPAPTAPPAPSATPAPPTIVYSYPIGWPGRPLGDGFVIGHGAGTENTWYAAGNWHTGEDWYAQEGDTAGAVVYAVAAGEVVYAGANYPGRVVIVRHDDGLYAMYGHLDPALSVEVGDQVARGQPLGSVLARNDGRAPSHLHFELRTFLLAREVNGAAPRYGFSCGVECPPGPGYWPIRAPDLPADQGWYNPTHAIARRMVGDAPAGELGAVVVATQPVSTSVELWSAPPGAPERRVVDTLTLQPGERLPLLALHAGPDGPRETSALAYELWYLLRRADGVEGWAQAAVPRAVETGSDGRPSSIGLNFVPAVLGGAGE